jgi:hypothetical protein
MSKINSYSAMSDRELLLVVVERQENQIETHKTLATKVDKIEEKILEDIENRVRMLENKNNEFKGAYRLWMFVITLVTLVSLFFNILNKWS